MPYKSEKIKIQGTSYDRHIKLSEEQKELIRWLRSEEQISYNQLAVMFNVSKRTIQFVCNPDKYNKCRDNSNGDVKTVDILYLKKSVLKSCESIDDINKNCI